MGTRLDLLASSRGWEREGKEGGGGGGGGEGVPWETRTRRNEGVRNLMSMICALRERAQERVSGVLLMPLTIGMAVR